VVAIVGFKQREVGLKQFRKALDVQPDIKLTKQLATPELRTRSRRRCWRAKEAAAGPRPRAAVASRAAGGGDDGGPGAGGDDDGPKPTAVKRPPPRKKKDEDEDESEGQKGLFFFGLTGGGGVGLVKGEGELDPNAHKLAGAGFAVAQTAQITPEIGVFVTPTLMISGQLRAQYVGGLNGKAGLGGGLRRRHVLRAGQRRLGRLREGDHVAHRCALPTHPRRPGRLRQHPALRRVPDGQDVQGVRHRWDPDLRRYAGRWVRS
jgi:hypothetical protein